jgi:hypothetical protein
VHLLEAMLPRGHRGCGHGGRSSSLCVAVAVIALWLLWLSSSLPSSLLLLLPPIVVNAVVARLLRLSLRSPLSSSLSLLHHCCCLVVVDSLWTRSLRGRCGCHGHRLFASSSLLLSRGLCSCRCSVVPLLRTVVALWSSRLVSRLSPCHQCGETTRERCTRGGIKGHVPCLCHRQSPPLHLLDNLQHPGNICM